MIRLTNLADYAVLLMTQIAVTDGRISAQQLSEVSSVPVPTVSKILNALSRADLLVSHRGLYGGFDLARPAEQISAANIIEAIDGPIALTHCTEPDAAEPPCGLHDFCRLKPRWGSINSAVRGALDAVSLLELLEEQTGMVAAVTEVPRPMVSAEAG